MELEDWVKALLLFKEENGLTAEMLGFIQDNADYIDDDGFVIGNIEGYFQ
ncbi:hypothetical protein HGT70_09405 [Rosenbergiella collisarenosi]|nr:hypothetical protein [Rosenbergiella collisarenosi]MBT0721499.1 hypothetical protein [Rosenbergiella collisarenosi]